MKIIISKSYTGWTAEVGEHQAHGMSYTEALGNLVLDLGLFPTGITEVSFGRDQYTLADPVTASHDHPYLYLSPIERIKRARKPQ